MQYMETHNPITARITIFDDGTPIIRLIIDPDEVESRELYDQLVDALNNRKDTMIVYVDSE